MLCYRCGAHVKDGSEKCTSCGQPFALGLKPGSIAGFGTGSRRGRAAIEGAPYHVGDAVGNRFQVKDHLGAGPLGWVFRALDTESGESVALKVLSPRFLQLPEEQAAFRSELSHTHALDHGNVARTVAAGLDGTRPWIAGQLLDGLTLRRIMDLRRQKGQPFALLEIEPIVAQIAAALDASPVPHGDLKPDNVVVLPDLLKLTDFGLALCLPRAPFVAAQRAGGMQRYFAPEMLAGQPLGGRADVFSLGVMLGEMLGGAPFDAQLETKIRAANIPIPVEQVFLRAVATRPEERYASAGDLSAALSDALHGTPPASEDDDVVIEHAQTDPRVRIARALAAQDAERPLRGQAAETKTPAESKSTPELPSSLQLSLTPLPPLSLTPLPPLSVPPLSMPPLALEPFSAPPPLAPSAPVVQAPSAPAPVAIAEHDLSREPRAALDQKPAPAPKPALEQQPAPEPKPAPDRQAAIETPSALRPIESAPIAAEGARGGKSADRIARVAASVGATPELLTAETAVRFAPTAPPAVPASAPAQPAQQPAYPPAAEASAQSEFDRDDATETDEPPEAPLASDPPPSEEESESGVRGKRRGRGRKGKREEPKARRSEAPPPSGPTSLEQRATALTQEIAPVARAKSAESVGAQNIGTQNIGTPTNPKAALEKPIEAPPDRAAARTQSSRPPASPPSFGALASEKRGLSVPTIAIGAVIAIGVLIFGWNQLSSKSSEEKPAQPDSAPSAPPSPATAAPAAPVPTPAPAKTEAAPAPAPVAPAPAPIEPVKPAPEVAHAKEPAEIPPSREFEEKASKGGKKSFLERLRERRDASKHSNKDEAAAGKPGASAEPNPAPPSLAPAAAPTPAPAPAIVAAATPPAPAPAAPAHPAEPAGGIGTGDDDLLVSRDRKPVAAAASAPAADACPEGMKLVPGGAAHIGTEASDDMRNFGDRSPATVQLKPYCIDLYEWPNAGGKVPKIAAGYTEADASCKKAGKRLCSEDEWEKACKGPSELRFPYGNAFDADACNTQDKSTNPRKVAPSGAFASCRSGYGIYDLSGNAAEWTASSFEGSSADHAVKGGNATRPGFDDRCSSRRRLPGSTHDINVGFRCCADSK